MPSSAVRRLGLLFTSSIALWACSAPNVAGSPLHATTLKEALGSQACAEPGVLPLEPDLMAWTPEGRGALMAAREDGVAVVRYEVNGCDVRLTLLNNCVAPGQYEFSPYWETNSKEARNATELFAKLPIGAYGLAAEVSGNRVLRTDFTLAGYAKLPADARFSSSDLRGPGCSGATHFVSRMFLGGFALAAGEERAIQGTASVFVEAGAKVSDQVRTLQSAGTPEACSASRDASAEKENCAIPLRVTLVPLAYPTECLDIKTCDTRCSAGDATSCVSLGGMYRAGAEGQPDAERAVSGFKRGCELGHPVGCGLLGVAYLTGQGIQGDYYKAGPLLNQACTAGDADACAYLGDMNEQGLGMQPNHSAALGLFDQACARGSRGACIRAASVLEADCSKNDLPACHKLGKYLWSDLLGAKDYPRAHALLRRACDGGFLLACSTLGYAYTEGLGVPKSDKKAVEILRDSCERGDGSGCTILAGLVATGRGTRLNEKESFDLLKRGCDLDTPDACALYGNFYEEGQFVKKDLGEARDNYQWACEHQSAAGCEALATLFENGTGVKADMVEAKQLYMKACQLGSEGACATYERLSRGR